MVIGALFAYVTGGGAVQDHTVTSASQSVLGSGGDVGLPVTEDANARAGISEADAAARLALLNASRAAGRDNGPRSSRQLLVG